MSDDDTYFKRGKSYIYASDLASKALARAAAKKDSVSALSQVEMHLLKTLVVKPERERRGGGG